MTAIRSILCPVDFSSPSDAALTYAIQLAKQLGASVHLVHAWQTPVYAFPDGAVIFDASVVTQITSGLQKRLDKLVARHGTPELPITAQLLQGPPDREITRVAKERAVDLVVMGTHGRTGVAHAIMGSVAERVMRTSRVPVLAVPAKRD